MTAYRNPSPRLAATLWYGPFDGRWARALLLLFIGAVLPVIAVSAERDMFQRIECTRPGVCTIRRGGAFVGTRVESTFDSASIAEARRRRTTGKNASDQLLLVRRDGAETLLVRGSNVAKTYPLVHRFFADPSERALDVQVDPEAWGTILLGAGSAVMLVIGLVLALAALSARARFRVSILHSEGIVRVEQVIGGRPRAGRDVPMKDIVDVVIETASGARVSTSLEVRGPARVVICNRLEADVPLSRAFYRGHLAHAAVLRDLREELGLPPPARGSR